MMKTKNKLIVALDVDTAFEALRLVEMLRDVAGMFKVGSQLFTAAGPQLVREIVAAGEGIFLDLKFHDIPNTVAAAGIEATRLGVSIFNVHAAGGVEMMKRVGAAVHDAAIKEGLEKPAVIAVTVLTSADQATLQEVGIAPEPEVLVRRLASLAASAGLDGVVASPQEITAVRNAVKQTRFMIVTPGIRPSGSDAGDQKRITTPREALVAGADYIVVGRPILQAEDPVDAARRIVAEMETRSASTRQ